MADWQSLRVLVTGASGFLGSNVCERLVDVGATTIGLARRALTDARIQCRVADLTDRAALGRIVAEVRPDVVFHLAGQTNASPDRSLVLPSFNNNLVSTVNLLYELCEIGCRRVVVTGSLEEPEPGRVLAGSLSPYGVSKWAEGVYARMFSELHGLPVTVARTFMTYGPRQHPTKLIPSVALALLAGRSPVVSQPTRLVDWIYVDDVVDGMLAAALTPGLDGRTVDFGSGALVSIRDVVATIEDVVGGPARVTVAAAATAVGIDGCKADIARTRAAVGWSPRVTLREGIEKTVAWYRGTTT